MGENLGALSALLQTLGAPPALHKPIFSGDLLATVNRALIGPLPVKSDPCSLSVGRVAIDPLRRKVWVSGVKRKVPGKRFDLLHALASRRSAMTVEELLIKAWTGKDNAEVVAKTLERLRKDLRLHDAIVVGPSGYRLVG